MNVLSTQPRALQPVDPGTLNVKHSAFPYQAAATREAKNLPYVGLFHEQGLGKTKIALDLAISWLVGGVVDSVLVVTKKSLVENWRRETGIHTHLRPTVLGQDRKANFFAFNRPSRLYVTHYEVVNSQKGRFRLFAQARQLGVILDEAQRIKNPTTLAAKALHDLAPLFPRRVVMTGTPVANRPYDLWSLIYFLDLGASLGDSFDRFKAATDLPSSGHAGPRVRTFEKALSRISAKIRPFTIRETKNSSALQLPEKDILYTRVDLEPAQADLYMSYRDELAAEVVREDVLHVDSAESILKRLLRLVQVASNPRLVDESYDATASKFSRLRELLRVRATSGPKAIVWTNFTENVSAVARSFPDLQPAEVHGRRPVAERNRDIRRFVEDPACRLLIATPGAAKEGLTLTVADYAVFLDRSFSLDDYLQAQDRIHRISQTRPCLIEVLLAAGTVDEWVDELLEAKHLAASLAQADMSLAEYRARATYDFSQTLHQILDIRSSSE